MMSVHVEVGGIASQGNGLAMAGCHVMAGPGIDVDASCTGCYSGTMTGSGPVGSVAAVVAGAVISVGIRPGIGTGVTAVMAAA